ncbi:MAG: hypothetical protein KJO60_05010 [Desulfofustis sp.]|nr:hypothetical protein [Desulfofustis sp.]
MKRASHEVFDPGDYDPVFKFELEMSLNDYLLVTLYLIFVAPFELLGWVIRRVYRAITGMLESLRARAEAKPERGLLSLMTKLF